MPKNLLLETASERVFSWPLSPQVLKTWAETNARIEAKVVARTIYESSKNTSSDKSPEQVLFPEDLTFWECAELIVSLEQRFWLQKSPHSTALVYKVKALIALLYKNGSVSLQDIEELTQTSSLSSQNPPLVMNQELRELLLSCQAFHQGAQHFEQMIQERIRWVILLCLLSTFTSHGANILLEQLTTFTQQEYDILYAQIISWEVDGEILDVYISPNSATKEVKIKTQRYHHFPYPIDFSQKIRLELFLEKLAEAREKTDPQEAENLERTIASIVVFEHFQYPWLATGSQAPAEILANKKMSCLWCSLVWSALLEKLSIRHTALISRNHIFLVVFIGNRSYIFDPTSSQTLKEAPILTTAQKSYDIVIEDEIETFYMRNASTEIPANIFVNLASQSHRDGIKEDALAYLDMSQLINPLSPITYYNKAGVLLSLKRHTEALPYYFTYLSYHPRCHISLNNIAHIFNLQKDFEKALSYVLQSLMVQPYSSTTWETLGEILISFGRRDKALLCELMKNLIAGDTKQLPGIEIEVQEQIKNLLEEEDFFSILELILWKQAMEVVAVEIGEYETEQ